MFLHMYLQQQVHHHHHHHSNAAFKFKRLKYIHLFSFIAASAARSRDGRKDRPLRCCRGINIPRYANYVHIFIINHRVIRILKGIRSIPPPVQCHHYTANIEFNPTRDRPQYPALSPRSQPISIQHAFVIDDLKRNCLYKL